MSLRATPFFSLCALLKIFSCVRESLILSLKSASISKLSFIDISRNKTFSFINYPSPLTIVLWLMCYCCSSMCHYAINLPIPTTPCFSVMSSTIILASTYSCCFSMFYYFSSTFSFAYYYWDHVLVLHPLHQQILGVFSMSAIIFLCNLISYNWCLHIHLSNHLYQMLQKVIGTSWKHLHMLA